MNQKNFENLQKIIIDFFKDVDNKIVSDLVDVFNYRVKASYPETNKLLDDFLDKNGIRNSFVNVLIDNDDDSILEQMNAVVTGEKSTYFCRATMSDREMINNITMALFNLIAQRFRNSIHEPKKTVKVKERKTNKNFNFIKNELLETFECLNRNEQYMYSEKEDSELIEKVKGLKND